MLGRYVNNLNKRTHRFSNFSRTYKICVVGSGPGAFYTAQELLKRSGAEIDIFERLPVPFGLVRYGVAPDHPEVKNCINGFTSLMQTRRCRFYGNVNVGKDISVEQLRSAYNGVVLAYGAENNRKLGIPGEDISGCYAAREFVGWYNGIPSMAGLKPDLSCENVVIFGHGNVALDVARMLLSPVAVLEKTDISGAALETLINSKIRNVYIIGRRGPLQTAFTIKEFRELTKLPNCHGHLDKNVFTDLNSIIPDLARPRRRLTELMMKTALSEKTAELCQQTGSQHWHMKFNRSPTEVLSSPNCRRVSGIRMEINKLEKTSEAVRAVGSGKFEDLACGLVISSIGYKSIAIDENVPFDAVTGIIPNVKGRVVSKRLYCSGWVKRGPIGVIASTMKDAFETAEMISEDMKQDNLPTSSCFGFEEIAKYLDQKGVRYVTFEDWNKIDAHEKYLGRMKNKPREKLTSVVEMLNVIDTP
ncbi:uncharacterized protein TRIADDRAFT_21502 [Trichoplax adhaerens]|uniref:NADPH:adrenodoxin oxidoreductase, mitochondrial n=1 Tax=Trichoplax adhaerens TaxID=10228 RepID=B3RN54_TRIAD|nr:hypothetical protein TRIADDRAFT_21502 [Trichoplax adhaerens]EDV27396.1 hypothetical protein TRIADDRAFT_21502 [Trichoplax adhaerens]|eukprot:XP_002109230.1 hypothetical protein TRIADDRAFT_21502 [Trichoplax adhaerens]